MSSSKVFITVAALAAVIGLGYKLLVNDHPKGARPPAEGGAITADPADYNLTLTSLDGKVLPLSDFKGKAIFLNFWATWCGPCRMEMPSIQRLYEKTKDKGLAIVAVSDESPEDVKKFAQANNYTFPVYTASQDRPAVYRAEGIPVTYLISPEGKIVETHLGAEDWSQEETVKHLISIAQAKP